MSTRSHFGRSFLAALIVLSVGCARAVSESGPVDTPPAPDAATSLKGDQVGRDGDGAEAETKGAADAETSVTADDVTADDVTADDARTRPAERPECLGVSQPITLVGQGLPYAEASVGPSKGWFLLDWATTASAIDPQGFPPPSPVPLAGSVDRFAGFEFFGPWGDVTLHVQDHSGYGGPIRQAGIVGTDFLALHVYTLDYAGGRVFRADGPGCDDVALSGLGLAALSTAGYFARELSRVTKGPNVPTVPVGVGAATAVAQLDTGFDDALVPNSMNINEVFFGQIAEVDRGTRRPDLDLTLTTCAGVAEHVDAYAAAAPLVFLGADGAPVREVNDLILFVKRTPAEAAVCGGIGTWNTPGAQVGASIIAGSGLVVFDPRSERVWMTATRGR
jgi:hypothetical protein